MPKGIYRRQVGLKRNRSFRPLQDRFWEKVEPSGDGCWRWLGFIDKAGYGRLHGPGRQSESLYAHRYSYEIHKGHLITPLEIDHLCRNRWCVNPDHLEAVTHATNVLRGVAPTVSIHHQTTCGRDHERTEENTYWRKDRPGKWNCRQCRRDLRALRKCDREAVS